MPDAGHGHVAPRPDGAKARCGGPAVCRICASELARSRQSELPSGESKNLAELRLQMNMQTVLLERVFGVLHRRRQELIATQREHERSGGWGEIHSTVAARYENWETYRDICQAFGIGSEWIGAYMISPPIKPAPLSDEEQAMLREMDDE